MRDGYRDTVTVTFRVNQSVWNATMTVRDSAGTPVHTHDLGYVDADTYLPATWTWDGSTDRGGVAGVGTHTVHVTGTALSTGITGTATATDPVTVATGWTTKRVTRTRAGTRGVAAARGTCRVTRHTGYGEAHLSCSGGRFARMTYTFPLPADATNVRWDVAGQLSSADVCVTAWSAARAGGPRTP